ncbi:MAG: hypothetical protein AB1397_07215 [bacterium]
MEDTIRYSQDNLPFISIRGVCKIRLNEATNERIDPELEGALINEGYQEEWIMKDELGYGNHLRSLSWIYPQSYIEKAEKEKHLA